MNIIQGEFVILGQKNHIKLFGMHVSKIKRLLINLKNILNLAQNMHLQINI